MAKQFKSNFDFSSIDPKKPASYGQIKGIGARFSGEGFKAVEKADWPQAIRILACIKEYHTRKNTTLTHGEVQKIREMNILPKKYRDMFDEAKIGSKVKANETDEPADTEESTETQASIVDLTDDVTDIDAMIAALKEKKAKMAKKSTKTTKSTETVNKTSEPPTDFDVGVDF